MFQLDKEQLDKLFLWTLIQDEKMEDLWKGSGLPGGAIGGAYTYCFTPTSLGVIVVVKNCVTKEEINLTDFDSW